MQTFLPHKSFRKSSRVLDYRRLGKQRVECKQLLIALTPKLCPNPDQRSKPSGWINHPCAKMWKDHEWWLCSYGIRICEEWISRGYNDSLLPWFKELKKNLKKGPPPYWLGRKKLHQSHRDALFIKDPEFYARYKRSIHGPLKKGDQNTSPTVINYWWPP